MRRGAYYNEHDPFAAAWLRNLISAGHIAPGDVDERDIRDIQPDDLRGYVQCHFFAGIGVWSYALRNAGWTDDRPIWTGSCPCQPFSSAGRGDGFADERHLWPHWFWLIGECRPAIVVGEQVASKDGLGWLDLVSADLEAAGYAVGASDLCAAGFSGAHIRQRLYFTGLAHHHHPRLEGREQSGRECGAERAAGPRGVDGRLAQPHGRQRNGLAAGEGRQPDGQEAGWVEGDCGASGGSATERLEHALPAGRSEWGAGPRRRQAAGAGAAGGLEHPNFPGQHERSSGREQPLRDDDDAAVQGPAILYPRQARSLDDVDWLLCRNPAGDPSWRPVRPGSFVLAHGVTARMGKLRAYGNALDAETATQFVGAVKAIDDFMAVV